MGGRRKYFPKRQMVLKLASRFFFAVLPVANLILLVSLASLLVLLMFLGSMTHDKLWLTLVGLAEN